MCFNIHWYINSGLNDAWLLNHSSVEQPRGFGSGLLRTPIAKLFLWVTNKETHEAVMSDCGRYSACSAHWDPCTQTCKTLTEVWRLFHIFMCFPGVVLQRRFHWTVYLRIYLHNVIWLADESVRCLKSWTNFLTQATEPTERTDPTRHFESAPMQSKWDASTAVWGWCGGVQYD